MTEAVVVVTTGGTVGARRADCGRAKLIDNAAAAHTAQLLSGHPGVRVHGFCQSSSVEMTPSTVISLARILREVSTDDDVVGVVVTVGTDTLEEVAYLLDLFWASALPLVITGSMFTPDTAGSDASGNLEDAIGAARSDTMRGTGAAVVFAGRIHDAGSVTKWDPAARHSFRSPGGLDGTVVAGRVKIRRPRGERQVLSLDDVDRTDFSVPLVTVVGGDDGTVARAVAASRIDGLVLAGTGAGNITRAVADAIGPLLASGTPVVVASRTGRPVQPPKRDASAARAALERAGCLLALGVGPLKARLLLLALLSCGRDIGQIRDAFGVVPAPIR